MVEQRSATSTRVVGTISHSAGVTSTASATADRAATARQPEPEDDGEYERGSAQRPAEPPGPGEGVTSGEPRGATGEHGIRPRPDREQGPVDPPRLVERPERPPDADVGSVVRRDRGEAEADDASERHADDADDGDAERGRVGSASRRGVGIRMGVRDSGVPALAVHHRFRSVRPVSGRSAPDDGIRTVRTAIIGPPMTAPSERPVVDPDGAPDANLRRERWVANILLAITFLFALIAQTMLFEHSTAMGGDVEYHRGVGFTMSAGSFSGEGPIHGVVSYFGGLYPLSLGWGSRLLGVSFDSLLSVVSWFFVLALPLALWWLGRRLWPAARLEPAVLAFVGTVGSSLALDDRSMWVYSVLPSGANLWPLYPRDVALVLFVVVLALVVGAEARGRIALAGLVAGVAIGTHAQLGVYSVAIAVAYLLWRSWPERAWRRWLVDSAIVGGVALGASVWWWWPRLEVFVETRRVVLKSFPTLTRPDSSPAGIVVALGFVGILAVPGVVLALRHRRSGEGFAAVWLLAMLPFALLGIVLGDIGIMTPRRVVVLLALPIVICAAVAATALLRRSRVWLVLPLVILAVVIPSASEAAQTRDLVSERWVPRTGHDPFAHTTWEAALETLQSAMLDRGSVQVIAADNDALFIWKHSGAQPFSFLAAGGVKLGFDPGLTTDYGYLRRVHLLDRAQAAGLPGLCRLAHRTGSDFIVARRDGDLLGTRDIRPSARYRVDPRDRDRETINRRVGPGVRYFDRSSTEQLQVLSGGHLDLDWSGPEVRRIDVFEDRARPVPPMTLELGDGTRVEPEIVPAGKSLVALRFATPDGVPRGSTLRVNPQRRVVISRIIGYERVPGLPGSGTGPVVLDPARVCS